MTNNEQSDLFLKAFSRLTGWVYVLCWSASFYPQPLLNWKKRSTDGILVDFPILNVLGFFCYTISTGCLLYSPVVRDQYAERHPLSPEPTVEFNDFAFGAHALVLVIITYSQFYPRLWKFHTSSPQRTSMPVAGLICGSILSMGSVFVLVRISMSSSSASGGTWKWVDLVYTIGYVKLVATFVKYVPQAWYNYKRKSTHGWSIHQILLDITGGVLSILQLVIDASFQGDWSGITGNPVKLGLGNVSILFDLIFITQHYLLYPATKDNKPDKPRSELEEPLLHP